MRAFAANFIPPHFLQDSYFREMLINVAKCGNLFQIPSKNRLQIDANKKGELGDLLKLAVKEVDDANVDLRSILLQTKSTLTSDGARNKKLDALNSALVFKDGYASIQSTNATGKDKDSDFIFRDIEKAIRVGGGDSVIFIVCLDGACKKVLRMIDVAYSRIFPQRCGTHAWSLLMKDIGSLFGDHLITALRLITYIVNHSGISSLFLKVIPTPKGLTRPVDTRFGSNFYVQQTVQKDKEQLRSFWHSQEFNNYLANPLRDPVARKLNLRTERNVLSDISVYYNPFWLVNELFVDIQEQCVIELRLSDTDQPNLVNICHGFEVALANCKKIASAFSLAHPGVLDIEQGLNEAFEKRRKDIYTPLALAASCINVQVAYTVPPLGLFPGSHAALLNVVNKYYRDDPDGGLANITKVMSAFNDFRMKKATTIFAEPFMKDLAAKGNHSEFWLNASMALPVCEIFCFLAHGYAGQGMAERMNKKVTHARSITRNRQSHTVTDALVKVNLHLRSRSTTGKEQRSFLELQKERCDKVIELVEDIRRERQARADAAVAVNDAAVDGDDADGSSGSEIDDADHGDVDDIPMMAIIEENDYFPALEE